MNHKFYLVALLLCTCICTICADSLRIPAINDNIVYLGRTLRSDSCVRFNFPGVTAILSFEGSSLSMITNPGAGKFHVEIDSLPPKNVWVAESDSILTVASGLDPELLHTARITYAIEGFEKNPKWHGFIIDGAKARLRKAERPQGPKIEFIGNSITCGYGTEASSEKERFSYETENHCLTYAWRTARALDADFNVVARSGIGVYRNYGDPREGGRTKTMSSEYGHTLLYDESHAWDHSAFEPDIICLNLGTNDTSGHNYDTTLLAAAFKRFHSLLRRLHPYSKIVLLTGTMMEGEPLTDVRTILDDIASQDELTYRFDMSPIDGSLGYGADYHPSSARHRVMAEELTAYLRTIID